jgi:cytochrome c oxidase assembly protein subunit 15
MWSMGYLGRLPAVLLPSPAMLVLLLVCVLGGGLVAGRHLRRNLPAAAAAGCITGALNLLVLGSFLGADRPGGVVPSAALWVPGSILLTVALSLAGSAAGARWFRAHKPFENWTGAFIWVAVAATSLLLAAGGLVTSAEAGMAVHDWPTSFGYNMFLYPFSRMTGGIYYEHAHRLLGFLVGLVTLVMAILLTRSESRRWIRRLAWIAVLAVVVQAVLGGLRVTDRMVHGILAQLFFSTLVALAAFNSSPWKGGQAATSRPGVRGDRIFATVLVLLIVFQLVLGAAQRHFQQVLLPHILMGLAVVAPACLHVGFKTWGTNPDQSRLRRLGLALSGLTGGQLLLGFGAYLATRSERVESLPASSDLIVSTLHQWTGAVLLALAVSILCWNYRLLTPAPTAR